MTEFRPSPFQVLPIVIKNLIIVNVLFFLAQYTIGRNGGMEDLLALHHVKSSLFKPWQLVTHMFLHGDFWHLFWNMFGLWMIGSVLENLWGPKRFLTFYFICGLGAALLHLSFLWYDYQPLLNDFVIIKNHPTPQSIISLYEKYSFRAEQYQLDAINLYLKEPQNSFNMENALTAISDLTQKSISIATLGASGAVFGLLAAFVYLFPNTTFYVYFLFPVKAKWVGLALIVKELFLAFQNGEGDNVARWAHIGGALVGFILVLTWNKNNRKRFY